MGINHQIPETFVPLVLRTPKIFREKMYTVGPVVDRGRYLKIVWVSVCFVHTHIVSNVVSHLPPLYLHTFPMDGVFVFGEDYLVLHRWV